MGIASELAGFGGHEYPDRFPRFSHEDSVPALHLFENLKELVSCDQRFDLGHGHHCEKCTPFSISH